MDINITQIDTAIVAKLAGEITAHTAPDVQANILPIAQPSSRILLDLSNLLHVQCWIARPSFRLPKGHG